MQPFSFSSGRKNLNSSRVRTERYTRSFGTYEGSGYASFDKILEMALGVTPYFLARGRCSPYSPTAAALISDAWDADNFALFTSYLTLIHFATDGTPFAS